MRPSSDPAWDGPANLRSALRVAVTPAASGLGVLVVMGDQVLPGAEVVKRHTEALDAFRARDFGPLGWVDKDRVVIARRRTGGEHRPAARLETRVEVVSLPAGCDGRLIRHALESGARGLVLEAMGRGNIPVTAVAEVERALAAGIPVVIATRCSEGRVLDTYAYEGGGRRLTEKGAILGGSLPAHKARLKLMLLLGADRDLAFIRAAFSAGADAGVA
jgi:L-asparaginase